MGEIERRGAAGAETSKIGTVAAPGRERRCLRGASGTPCSQTRWGSLDVTPVWRVPFGRLTMM